LQKLENDKYIALDVLLKSNPSPDNVAQQQTIINDITAISTLRSNLFDTLLNNANSNSKVNEQINSNLENKNTIKTLKESSLDAERAALEAEDATISNANRMVDINTYYHKQYEARVKIMKFVVLICFVIIFFIILMHLGWLPQELVTVIVVITLFAGLAYAGYLINDMYQRSKINFDEYDFPVSSDLGSKISQSTKSKKKSSSDSSCLYNSLASSASTLEDSISSKATALMDEVSGGTPDPSQSSSSLSSVSTSAGGSTDADGTTLPSVKSKLSESFTPMMSRMDRRQFSSNDFAAYDSENNYGKI
jgi:ABC-type multidrug transport system fused ATPase/permease subunit